MAESRTDRGSGESSWRFQLGCALMVLIVLAVAALVPRRVGQLMREKAAVESLRELGGTVVYGKEVFATEWFQWLLPARVMSVNLAGARATNADLVGLGYLTSLERLYLDHTLLTGGGLEPISGLARLQTLSLEDTGIGDDDLRHIARLARLSTLRLAGTQISGAGLEHLGKLISLQSLSIAQTRITDAGLARLRVLEGLQQLSIDENQVTPACVAHLRALASLRQLCVYVPRGTGKLARDVLASFSGVEVSGIRRLPKPAGAQSAQLRESRLWDGVMPWETTTGGVVEAILAEVPLPPEQSERLLDILAEARSAGDWRGGNYGPRMPPPPAAPKGEPIKDNDEFVQTLKTPRKGDWDAFGRALAYARNDVARATIPALLEFLKSPDEWLRQRAATILIRIGLDDPRVVAAIRDMLRSYDLHDRWRAVYAFNIGDWRWRYGDIAPKMKPAEAKVAVSLLLEMPEDECRDVRSELPRALASIVRDHPQEAERAIPVALKTLADVDISVRHAGQNALEAIAEVSPGQVRTIVQRLIRMLEHYPGEVEGHVLEVLQTVGRESAEAADAAMAALRRSLRNVKLAPVPRFESGNPLYERQGGVHPGVVWIADRHPRHVKEIVLTALRMIDDADPRAQSAASLMLTNVAAGIGQRNTK